VMGKTPRLRLPDAFSAWSFICNIFRSSHGQETLNS
jgi:hypothetical protein